MKQITAQMNHLMMAAPTCRNHLLAGMSKYNMRKRYGEKNASQIFYRERQLARYSVKGP